MNTRTMLLAGLFGCTIPLWAAPMALGTKIGLDFGPTATNVTGNDWLEITANATIAAGSVKNLNAVVVDGVALTTANGQFWNNDGNDNWVALASNPAVIPGAKLPPEFIDSVTTDIAGNYSLGDATPYTITLTGLSTAFAYDIVAASTAAAGGTVIDTYNVTGVLNYGPSAVTRSNASANGVWHSIPGVVPTAAGTITIKVSDTSAGTNPITNGILITAVNYPDSDTDGLPNHWETLNGLNPNDNTGVNGASGDPDADGFTNLQEYQAGSNPQVLASTPLDTDADGLADAWEIANFGNLAQTGSTDYDGDLATNEQEETAGSNPKSAASWPDSDGDGMNDLWETARFGGLTHDGTADTDGDTWTDKEEHDALSDPNAPNWTPVLASLSHRWSFNGDLTDSVGSSPATIVEVGANNVTQNPTNVAISGGTRSIADYVSLGSNLIGGRSTPVTIELWATQNSVQNYGRIFDLGSGTSEFLLMTWSNGVDVNGDTVRWQDAANASAAGNNAPYTTGTEYHIVMTIEPGKGTAGTTLVTWYSAPSAASDLGAARGSFSTSNTLAALVDSLDALGRSPFTTDGTANATYNEVRLWNGSLGAVQREALHDQNADNAATVDADADGLPDAWESAHGLSAASATGVDGAEGDPDGDGVTNRHELAAGSDPRDNRWKLDGNGDWNTPSNWVAGSAPNAIGAVAILDDPFLTGPVVVTLDAPVTAGTVRINSTRGYTLAGVNSLTLDNGSTALVQVTTGGPVVQVPVIVEDPVTFEVGASATATIEGSLSDGSASFGLSKTGTGELRLAGETAAYTGAVALNGGVLALTRTGDFTLANNLSGTGRLAHRGGGVLALTGTNTHGGTDVTNGGTLSLGALANLGNGGVSLADATLLVTATLDAGTRAFTLGAGGGRVEVAGGATLSTIPFSGTAAPVEKRGSGTWRLSPGSGASVGLLTLTEGALDLNRNDAFGTHTLSTQDMVVEGGTVVSNGSAVTSGYNTIRNLTLNGGELRVTGTARAMIDGDLFKFEAYGIKGTVTVGGSAPSSIANPGTLANAGINIGGTTTASSTTFTVADVTNDSAADLTVSAVLKDNYTAAYARLANGLTKTGPGAMVCTAFNRYTGNTVVAEGTLSLAQACLADTADVALAATATLDLNHSATDVVDEFTIDGVPQFIGTWGATGNALAQHTTDRITGTGLLQVTTGPSAPYASWAAGFAGFANTAADIDFDHDGLPNGIEYVVGADPTAHDAAALAPAAARDGTDLVFTFRRTDLARTDANTTITAEYSTGLGVWFPAVHGSNGVTITEAEDDFGPGIDRVTVRLPQTLAPEGTLFVRLRADITTP